MKNEAKKLVKEFKAFLLNNEEDDFTLTAGALQKAPAVLPRQAAAKAAAEPPQTPAHAVAAPVAEPIKTAPKPQQISTGVTPMSSAQNTNKDAALKELADQILVCKKCPLGATRLNAVPGEGNANARLMFVGEGPGFDEDHKGRPFIGRAGTLLTKMIEAMGLSREEVFIANMVKCHPMTDPSNPERHGNDRAPSKEEIAYCRNYIEAQIGVIRPEYIVALGGVAAKALIRDADSLGALRRKIHTLDLDSVDLGGKTKIIATYHPAALLRNPNWKKDAWDDLKMLMKDMGITPPANKGA
ncbi:DNA polymerase [Elusimicrobium simillimum]|uniref:uracil-DNA glycosylase n=1 Tax=Elusimicrobium simillimum TaxID=3143438 RepID=UPI003C6F56F0